MDQGTTLVEHVIEHLPAGVVVHAPDTRILIANEEASRLLGLAVDPMLGKTVMDPAWRFVREDGSPMPVEEFPVSRVLSEGTRIRNAALGIRQPGSEHLVWVQVCAFPDFDEGGELCRIIVTFTDITELKEAQVHLARVQKMESVGRLAGGIAHDFNNMLCIILNNVEESLSFAPAGSDLCEALQDIHAAAEHSASLTRQLLAFSRQQPIQPRLLDLNQSVEVLLKMLRRLLGENVHLQWRPKPALPSVRLDAGQLDQVLTNLCVNARDAVEEGGTITISTDTASFDAEFCARRPSHLPGDFVVLSVADDGCGMSADTLERMFEPFYTTKGVGEGTGLGLATVYGIVSQHGGFITVKSRPNEGATLRLHLPQHTGSPRGELASGEELSLARGNETILVVEDEPSVLRLAQRALERLGYTVLAASTPGAALRFSADHDGPLDLLLTDVILPDMNGRELAKRIAERRPGVRQLFSSGYTAEAIARAGVLEEEIHVLRKPFSLKDLARAVRRALDS